MSTRGLRRSVLAVGALVAITASVSSLTGHMFRIDATSRILGFAAFALLAIWFPFLDRRRT